ncbi:hypothetical protein PM082_009625 [Marasmius tenuissimus]|nr:hypothetical protein PM082_009625 [Marasmius tenuissimus]
MCQNNFKINASGIRMLPSHFLYFPPVRCTIWVPKSLFSSDKSVAEVNAAAARITNSTLKAKAQKVASVGSLWLYELYLDSRRPFGFRPDNKHPRIHWLSSELWKGLMDGAVGINRFLLKSGIGMAIWGGGWRVGVPDVEQ